MSVFRLRKFALPRRVSERLNKVVNDRAHFLRDMAVVRIDCANRIINWTGPRQRVDKLTVRERLVHDEYRQNRKPESGDRSVAHRLTIVGGASAANDQRRRLDASLRRFEVPKLTRMSIGVADTGMLGHLLH